MLEKHFGEKAHIENIKIFRRLDPLGKLYFNKNKYVLLKYNITKTKDSLGDYNYEKKEDTQLIIRNVSFYKQEELAELKSNVKQRLDNLPKESFIYVGTIYTDDEHYYLA